MTKTTEAAETKKFRIVGVPRPRSIRSYARQIEATMNELVEEGYDVQLSDDKNGTLVIGRRAEEERPSPLMAILGGLPGISRHAPPSLLSDKTREIVQRFIRAIPRQEPDSFRSEARKQATMLLKGFTVDEITVAVDETVKEADAHEKTHDPGDTCTFPACLRALSEILKETAALQLQ